MTIDQAVRGRPVVLPFEPDPVLAFLHVPHAANRQSTAALMCPPFGWDETCSYRGQRTWADALARAGYPAARINLPATGDSGGNPRDPGRLDSWTAAVSGAAQWLREATGSDRIVAIGIGLGGMLACRSLAGGAPIDDLILWAVPEQGRILLRDARAYASMAAARYPEDMHAGSLREGDLELTGFLVSSETAGELKGLQLAALEVPQAQRRRVLMFARDGLPVDKRLREHFERAGAAVTVETADDYGVLMAEPQRARPPDGTIAKTISWLAEGPSDESAGAGAPTILPAVARKSMELSHEGIAISETPLRLGSRGGETFGVLAESAESASAQVCAVLLNGGALRHIGPNRAWVEVARRWAARGVPTIRVDLEGIGDSDGDERRLLPNRSLYAEQRTDETLALLDQLAARGLPNRFILGGLCSGAYWSLHAALADARVVSALMINLYAFLWSEALVAERETQGSLDALRGIAWRRLWHRDVTMKQFNKGLQSVRPSRLRAGAGRRVEGSQREQVELALDRLRDQGTQALLLLSRGEPLHEQLVRQRVLDRIGQWPNLTVEQIPSRDHLFRTMWLQRHVHESLDRALDRVLDATA